MVLLNSGGKSGFYRIALLFVQWGALSCLRMIQKVLMFTCMHRSPYCSRFARDVYSLVRDLLYVRSRRRFRRGPWGGEKHLYHYMLAGDRRSLWRDMLLAAWWIYQDCE